ncbi:GTP cyclohydrolase 1 [Candidatus Hodgkinia cicadicola]|uniref:GTP cyclohydrolase I n=2 Tax=Candidatus Hodgkinia cicadicola TaxID=573658 RepID=A0ABX4MH80_9HYPH|nr:GTP cyclohydrolase 1 [Candidatus Hodgkinia cicadicola]PIM95930.1 GTP cyclohydrolase 1 [Candidatus Hodgkinia cicadicola]
MISFINVYKMTNKVIIKKIIEYVGDDSNRNGLRSTPIRVIRSLREMYCGYKTQLPKVNKSFSYINSNIDLVYIKNVFISSNCEHHMLPFFGQVNIVYCPSTMVLGLSKFINILNFYSTRLQTQERLAQQVVTYIKNIIRPKAIMLKLSCKHVCMLARGVKSICSTSGIIINEGLSVISPILMNKMLTVVKDE